MEQDHLIEYVEFLKDTKGLSEKSIADYFYWIKNFDLNQISQEYINKFIQDRGNNSGVRGAILNFLEYTGLKKVYDLPPKRTGRKKKRIIRNISKEEIDLVRKFLYNESFLKGLLFELMYQGALRRIELPTIKLNSFKWLEWINDPSNTCKLIIKGKGNKERIVLINPETAELIFNHYNTLYNFKNMEEIRDFANSPTLLFSKGGIPINLKKVYDVIHKGSIKAIGRDIRPHELRHNRAEELEKMGVPIKDIKNYLGHTSLATTEIYLHSSEKESIENINKILKENSLI